MCFGSQDKLSKMLSAKFNFLIVDTSQLLAVYLVDFSKCSIAKLPDDFPHYIGIFVGDNIPIFYATFLHFTTNTQKFFEAAQKWHRSASKIWQFTHRNFQNFSLFQTRHESISMVYPLNKRTLSLWIGKSLDLSHVNIIFQWLSLIYCSGSHPSCFLCACALYL